jgi:hypothetical protein
MSQTLAAMAQQAAEKTSQRGHAFTACGKTHVSEGYGLQAVRKCFAMNPALAAEGRFPSKQHFSASCLAVP